MAEAVTEYGEMYRAKVPALSPRLLAAAGLVRKGQVAADIGCDHGKLAVWLALRGVCPRVIAVDNRPMPLAKARALARQTGCQQVVDCRLGEGLAPLQPHEATDIVIAGLSGETMTTILEQGVFVQSPGVRLVLVPTTRHAMLRRYLCGAGFAIAGETPVLDKGRPYTVLCADYTGEATRPSALFCEVGLVPQTNSEAATAYVQKRLQDVENRGKALQTKEEKTRHAALVRELEQCLL